MYFTRHVTNIGVKDYKDEERGQYLANYSVFPVYIDVDHFQLGAGNVKAPGSHIWIIPITKDTYSNQKLNQISTNTMNKGHLCLYIWLYQN